MASNVKVIYPSFLGAAGDLVKVNPIYIPENLVWKLKYTPPNRPLGVVLNHESFTISGEVWFEIGFPEGSCWVVERAINLC